MLRSNKEVTLKTREGNLSLYRKAQKLKIAKSVFRKFIIENSLKIFFFLGKSHSAGKMKSDQLSQN